MLGRTHVELHWAVLTTQHPRPSPCRVSELRFADELVH
jgi:hypothetical protein